VHLSKQQYLKEDMESNTKQHEAAKPFVSPVDYDEYKQYGDDAAVIYTRCDARHVRIAQESCDPIHEYYSVIKPPYDDYAFDSKPSGENFIYMMRHSRSNAVKTRLKISRNDDDDGDDNDYYGKR
jgi:hypothetical protein